MTVNMETTLLPRESPGKHIYSQEAVFLGHRHVNYILTVNSFLLLTDIMGIERLFLSIQIQIHGKTVQHAHQCQLTTL